MGTSSSESTDGVEHILHLEKTQNSVNDHPATQPETSLTQIDAKGKTANKISAQDKPKLDQKNKGIETLDETTQHVDDQVKTAERLLDRKHEKFPTSKSMLPRHTAAKTPQF
jgi:hypothetical protein